MAKRTLTTMSRLNRLAAKGTPDEQIAFKAKCFDRLLEVARAARAASPFIRTNTSRSSEVAENLEQELNDLAKFYEKEKR